MHERALQARAVTAQHREARAGDLGGALEVEDPQRLADLVVGARLEVEPRGLAPAAHHHVVSVARAARDRLVRRVGNVQEQLVQP